MNANSVPGYLLVRKLAEGGCAEIYEGIELEGKRKVAIKILHPRHLANKVEYKRLLHEGALGMRLRHHENIVQTLQIGTAEKTPFIVMELLGGGTLRELLRERKKLKNAEIVRISESLGRAMRFMHTAGIYHKDLKPDNVMLDGKGMIKVIDLGFAESHLAARFSLFGRALEGSPAYMSPDLIRTKKPTAASDLYALGCTLYEAATGRVPFHGSSDNEVLSKQLNMGLRPDPIAELNPEISLFTQKLILNALEKDTEHRYKSIDEFLLELARNPLLGGSEKSISVPLGWTRGK